MALELCAGSRARVREPRVSAYSVPIESATRDTLIPFMHPFIPLLLKRNSERWQYVCYSWDRSMQHAPKYRVRAFHVSLRPVHGAFTLYILWERLCLLLDSFLDRHALLLTDVENRLHKSNASRVRDFPSVWLVPM